MTEEQLAVLEEVVALVDLQLFIPELPVGEFCEELEGRLEARAEVWADTEI